MTSFCGVTRHLQYTEDIYKCVSCHAVTKTKHRGKLKDLYGIYFLRSRYDVSDREVAVVVGLLKFQDRKHEEARPKHERIGRLSYGRILWVPTPDDTYVINGPRIRGKLRHMNGMFIPRVALHHQRPLQDPVVSRDVSREDRIDPWEQPVAQLMGGFDRGRSVATEKIVLRATGRRGLVTRFGED